MTFFSFYRDGLRAAVLASAVLAAAVARAIAAPTLVDLSGDVSVAKGGSTDWQRAAGGRSLVAGDAVRTGRGGKVSILFDDQSKVTLGPVSTFILEKSDLRQSAISLGLGSLRAFISKVASRRFQVRTPTAVCSVRGTEFNVNVDNRGNTGVQMMEGLLAVADNHGNELLIKDKERVEVTDRGLGTIEGSKKADADSGGANKLKDVAKREVDLQMSKEEVQAAAASEAKNAVYQDGKAVIDVNGNRVRIESYIVRPADDQFKLVILNERSDRFDYFFYRGTFNTKLPDDLSTALRQLPGCIGAPCQYFMTDYATGRSNTIDNMLEVASGGHQVDVNNNGHAADAVAAAFDPVADRYVDITGQSFFKTLYNNYSLTFNGVVHQSWAPQGGVVNIANTSNAQVNYNNVTTVQNPPGCAPPNCTYNEDGVMHGVVYAANGAGTIWEKYDSYIISDDGKVAKMSDFANIRTGAAYKQTLLNWNFQTIVTASEFNGRKIDLVVAPKIFIQSGLIP